MNKARGFSLIEMLVVMTVMGLIVSVVSLSTGGLPAVFGNDGNASAEAFADDLMRLMATASAEAILGGEPVAMTFVASATQDDDGVAVSWLRYGRIAGGSVRSRQPVWQSVSAQSGLRELHMPSVIYSELVVEGEVVNPRVLAGSPDLPALVFYPTGETTGFNWNLSQGEHVVTLTNAATGEIEKRQP